MTFNSFDWFSEILSFSLQLACIFKLNGPRSLRSFLVLSCFGNVAAVATHTHPLLYWDQLWLIRIAAILMFLWAVGDVASIPNRAHWILRLPVIGCAILAIPYWPMRPENGPFEMEMYRFFGLCMGLLILALYLIFLYADDPRLPIALAGCLAIEATASGAYLFLGLPQRLQMAVWWVALAFLGTALAGRQSQPPAVLNGIPTQRKNHATGTDELFRLPLSPRLWFEQQISSRYSP